jgi:DNA-binding transcriptional regulator PaaX
MASFAALRRIELHAAEACLELLGILQLGEAVHMKPLAVIDGVPSGAESQIVAEIVNLLVAAALTKPGASAI